MNYVRETGFDSLTDMASPKSASFGVCYLSKMF